MKEWYKLSDFKVIEELDSSIDGLKMKKLLNGLRKMVLMNYLKRKKIVF